jgi:hypothetical protein
VRAALFLFGPIVAMSLIATSACRKSKDPIAALLDRLEAAAEKRDASALASHLAADFRGQHGETRSDAEALLRRYLTSYETVRLEIYDVAITRNDSDAILRFRVDFSGQALKFGGLNALLPPSAMYRFELGLELEGDEWKIARADWEDLDFMPAGKPSIRAEA